jgi:hypothetical protein
MSTANDLSRMVPGFEFLQSLIKGAGASLPGVQGFGQWVAPTLDPEEIDKRIQELKTVQFWLEQNARLLGTTVQALEVQRMTLSTLQTMNLPLVDLRNALQARPAPLPPAPPAWTTPAWAAPAAAKPAADEPAADDEGDEAAAPQAAAAAPAAPSKKPTEAAAAAPAAIDPLQWWSALTQQFTEIATKAVQDSGADAARHLAAAKPAAKAKPETKPAPAKAAKPSRAGAARKRAA